MLSSGKVNAIGLVPFGRFGIAQFFKNPYQRDFLAGVAQACEERGVGLSLVSGRDDQEAWGIKNALVDGFIFTGVDQVELLEAGRRRRLPFVVMDLSGSPHISSVNTKNRDGAKQATRHLLALGHRRFVIASTLYSFRAPVFHPPAESARRLVDAGPPLLEKLAGVADALAEAELSINDVPIVEACGTPEEEKAFGNGAAIQRLESPPPVAQHLLGVVEALLGVATQGLRKEVPQPLSQRGIKSVRCDCGLVLCDEGLSCNIAPGGRDTGDEFMQRDRSGISLRMQVPTALGPQCEEGIEVGPGPGLNVLGRRPGERERSHRTGRARMGWRSVCRGHGQAQLP